MTPSTRSGKRSSGRLLPPCVSAVHARNSPRGAALTRRRQARWRKLVGAFPRRCRTQEVAVRARLAPLKKCLLKNSCGCPARACSSHRSTVVLPTWPATSKSLRSGMSSYSTRWGSLFEPSTAHWVRPWKQRLFLSRRSNENTFLFHAAGAGPDLACSPWLCGEGGGEKGPPGRLSASPSSLHGDEEGPFPQGPSSLREPEVQDMGMSTLSIT
jgi:hypothetical protein